MNLRQVEGLKRYLKKMGGRNYYLTPGEQEKKLLEGTLYSNGIVNHLILNLLFP